MDSPILTALPSIHSTLIGFVGAFYAAFATYAFQKLFVAKEAQEKVVEAIEEVKVAAAYVQTNSSALLTSEGDLDWDKCVSLLMSVSAWQFRTDEQREELRLQVLNAIRLIFASSPFVDVSQLAAGSASVEANSPEKKLWDEASRRLDFLGWWLGGHGSRFQALLEDCMRIDEKRERANFDANMERMGDAIPEEEKQRIWIEHHQPNLRMFDYREILSVNAEIVSRLSQDFFPRLKKASETTESSNRKLQIKTQSIAALEMAIYVLILGVFVPPAFQMLRLQFPNWVGLNWSGWDYSLLAITFWPYALVGVWLWRTLKKLPFR